MRVLKVYQVDSFTREKFKGNPAGVVLNADGLTDGEMLSIARELNNSETAFIFQPDGADHEVRIRYFTPKTEVPVCGHATIAAHYVRAMEYQLETSVVWQKISIGILPVEVVKAEKDYSIIMTQGSIEFQSPLGAPERGMLLEALGLQGGDLDQRCPVQVVSTGHGKVMIGIKSRQTLDSLSPDMMALTQISGRINCNGYFIFTLDSEHEDILTHGRMFAPAIGVNEDPVTGNAHGPLGAYLVKHGLAPRTLISQEGTFSFTGEQGYAIGRSGLVHVAVQIENGEPKQVKVAGSAVIVFQTEIRI